jgi:hypothetical protein
LQSWFWGVNGATSVFGSVLGVVISIEIGITAAFWTGVACYVLCMVLIYRNTLPPGHRTGSGASRKQSRA